MNGVPIITVLIPTWNAAGTLGPAIDSARAQTIRDIEILVVGDGASDEAIAPALDRAVRDPRVRVLRQPKAPGRGEANRHAGVLAARAPAVAYLADDDLLMPRHLENLVPLLRDHDLVQSRNGWIDRAGQLHLLAADLADPRWREFHLLDPPLNRISISGTAHTLEAYRRAGPGWIPPERADISADLTLWRQLLGDPAVRAATHPEMTTLQFPAPERVEGDDRAVRARWARLLTSDNGHETLQRLAEEAARRELLDAGLDVRALTVALHRARASGTPETSAESAEDERP